MLIRDLLIPEFEEEMANTRKILERVPEEKMDYKPHEKSMTLGRLAGHVAEMPTWAKTTMETEKLDLTPEMKPYTATSRAQLLADFDKNVAEARGVLSGSSDDDFMKTWTLSAQGKVFMSMPKHKVIRSMVMNHMIHHRAQLGVYLRLNELELPGMYGPSADEMKFWNAQPAKA
jgi:uncharacterized damage-inducible protein DinB